jgi:hypothetical protein
MCRSITPKVELVHLNNNTVFGADNDVTRAIDSQRVIAPQYGVGGGSCVPKEIPVESDSDLNITIRLAQYPFNVRTLRTRDLKIIRESLTKDIPLAIAGQIPCAVTVIQDQLDQLDQELLRRHLRARSNHLQHEDVAIESGRSVSGRLV